MSKMSTKEAQEKKSAAKPEKKGEKKSEKAVGTLYKIEGEQVTRLRPTCERCGPGYFMAKHKDRYTCGHCGFTRYRQIEK